MKFTKFLVTFIISLFAFNTIVYAASSTLSVSSDSVYVGDSFTVTVNINSSAAWNVHTSVSGPASGCIINQADSTADAMDTSKTFTATCTATQTGTITITLSGDVTSAVDGNAVNVSGTRKVIVSEKPQPAPDPTPDPAPSNNQSTPTNPSNSNNHQTQTNTNETPVQPSEPQSVQSSDTSLQSLTIDDIGDILEENQFDYEFEVPFSVDFLSIEAICNDSNATVNLPDDLSLEVGENYINIEVIAEDGSSEVYTLTVTRLEDTSEVETEPEPEVTLNNAGCGDHCDTQNNMFMYILFGILGVLFVGIILFLFLRKKKASTETDYSNPTTTQNIEANPAPPIDVQKIDDHSTNPLNIQNDSTSSIQNLNESNEDTTNQNPFTQN